ncbi:hypothetical protein I552_8976 [Mycobacterium xenopi 3993]|nr:hypothetical protein I552_8976 [Mycobacterium xenopi 3993]
MGNVAKVSDVVTRSCRPAAAQCPEQVGVAGGRHGDRLSAGSTSDADVKASHIRPA